MNILDLTLGDQDDSRDEFRRKLQAIFSVLATKLRIRIIARHSAIVVALHCDDWTVATRTCRTNCTLVGHITIDRLRTTAR
jgi:hypothetical protein